MLDPAFDPSRLGDILVVDDTPANLRLLVVLLNQHGYHARPAISGRLAISGARSMPPDLILLDIMMPDLDGYDVCTQLKADARTREIPVVFVSALDEGVDKARAFAVGGADYIPKPFHPLEVIARVDNQLRLQATQRQLQARNRQLHQFTANLKELHRLRTTAYTQVETLFADYLQAGCAMLGFTTGCVARVAKGIYHVEAVYTDRQDFAVGWQAPLEVTYCGEVVARGATLACGWVGNEPSLCDRAAYHALGFESYLSTPIWVNGSLYGTLGFAAAAVRSQEFDANEREIIELMAESLGNFIAAQKAEQQRQQAEQKLQALASQLEQRVAERTAQLGAANENLRAEIRQRVQAQAELAASTEQLQAVLDAVPGFVSWLNILGANSIPYYLGVNRLLAEACQQAPEDFVGQPVGFLSRGSEFTHFIHEFFYSPAPAASTVAQLSLGDSQHHYLVVAQKYQHQQAAVCVGIDITARVEAEQRLQQAYQRLQLLSELTLKIRQSLDIKEILRTATQEVRQLLGADRVLIVTQAAEGWGQIVQESVLPEWLSLQGAGLAGAAAGCQGATYQEGQPVVIADVAAVANLSEAERHYLALAQVQAKLIVPIFVQAAVWGALVIHQCREPRQWQSEEIELLQQFADQIGIALSQAQLLDQLEERVAERTAELEVANQQLQQEIRERQRVEADLRHSEQQLRRAIDSNTYGMVVYTATGEVRFMNRAAAMIFGGLLRRVASKFLALPLSSTEAWELEIPRSQEQSRIVEVRTVDLRWEGEAAILASLMDITERKAIEQMKDEFLSVASHELRTPLTSIRGSLGLLATGRLGQLSEKGRRMLDIAVNNANRLSRLIDDILDLERMKSGRVQIVKGDCAAGALLVQAVEAMQSMADQAGVELQVESPQPEDLQLWADPDQMLQTLTNLISNGIKFSLPGGRVALGAREGDPFLRNGLGQREVLLWVRDQGRGIPADKLETIFGRFQQVDASDSREKGGTGLGLAICREIVARHGGRIWAESKPGQGSCFYVALPHPSQADQPSS